MSCQSNGNTYIASTKNILVRSKIDGDYIKTNPCYLYTIQNNELSQQKIREAGKDLQ